MAVRMAIEGAAASPLSVRALRVPYAILMPIIIIIFCITGAYSLKNSVWDVGQMLFGVLGYAMKKLGYSPAALVLGPLAERALRQSLIISDAGLGSFSCGRSRRCLLWPRLRRWACRWCGRSRRRPADTPR